MCCSSETSVFRQLVQCDRIRHKGVFIWNRDSRPVLRHRNVSSAPCLHTKVSYDWESAEIVCCGVECVGFCWEIRWCSCPSYLSQHHTVRFSGGVAPRILTLGANVERLAVWPAPLLRRKHSHLCHLDRKQGGIPQADCTSCWGESLAQGWRTFERARAQIVYKFLRNSFACPWEFWRAE